MFQFALRASRTGLVLLSFVVLFHFAVPAHAATYVVDTTSDSNLTACTSAANDCSLRGAISDANLAGGTNSITFDASTNGTAITLTSLLPQINDDLTITGNGATNTIIDGAGSYQVFYIVSGKTVSLSDLTVQNGSTGLGGGGIDNDFGTLTVSNCTFSGNTASYGGGIYSDGTLTVTSSTFSGNSADGGGGICTLGTLTVTSSTFSKNSALDGGGIYSKTSSGTCADSPLTYIANSTFSGNSATGLIGGGGISNENGVTALVYNTVSGSPSGGGVSSINDGFTCTLAAGNIIFGNTGYDVSAYINPPIQRFDSLGYNLVGVAGSNVDFNQEFNATGDLTGPSHDPVLGALADNGGPTQTMLPGTGSAAINAGDNALAVDANGNPLMTDQRGYARISGGTVDIGAVEVQLPVTAVPTLSWGALAALGLILAAAGLLLASKARSS